MCLVQQSALIVLNVEPRVQAEAFWVPQQTFTHPLRQRLCMCVKRPCCQQEVNICHYLGTECAQGWNNTYKCVCQLCAQIKTRRGTEGRDARSGHLFTWGDRRQVGSLNTHQLLIHNQSCQLISIFFFRWMHGLVKKCQQGEKHFEHFECQVILSSWCSRNSLVILETNPTG